MKKFLSAALLLSSVISSAMAVAGQPVAAPVVSEVWISEAPPVAKNNAAYAVVRNGERKDVLLGAETPVAETVEFHEMSMSGGLMRMRQLPLVKLAPNAELRFAPGGYHLMLINMKRPLKAGDKVPVTFRFRRAGKVTVEAEVRAPEVDTGPDHTSGHAH